MKSLQRKTTKTILWIARIWGGTVLSFFMYFLLAHLFGTGEGGEGFRSTSELLSFLCFPVGTCIGLALALKWEGLGGLVTLINLIGLFILRTDLISIPYFSVGIGVPGSLYIIYWLLRRRSSHVQTEFSNS